MENEDAASGYIDKAIAYIHQHYDHDFRTGDIAALLGIHENYLQRVFKKRTGSTLIQALNEVRMEKASMLLSNTLMTVTEISESVGINSSQYFSKLFKERYKVSPMAYRASVEKLEYERD